MKKFFSILLILVVAIGLVPGAVHGQDLACDQDVVVQADDWLSKVADKVYGDALAFPAIVEATNAASTGDDSYAAIDNPDVIEVGQKLCVPSADAASAFLSDSGSSSAPAQVAQSGLVFGLATHEAPGDSSFWGVVERGSLDAAAAVGAELKSGGSLDPSEQAQLVETYTTEGVDGIIVSLANPDAMEDSVRAAIAAGIPVITINSGVAVWEDLGALTHVGQTEFVAGEGAGKRLTSAGATKVLCVVHEEANIGLEERCDGLEAGFDGEIERFNVATTGTADIAGTLGSIQDKLIADSSIDAVLALNPDVGIAAKDAIAAAGTGQMLGTFDLSPDVLDAIDAGEIMFAIDQQQYLQGYLPVIFLYLNSTNLNVVGGGNPVLTGPGFVDASNAASVKALADSGTR